MASFFIRRPIVAIVIAIITVLLGLNSLRGLSFEQYPFLAPPTIRSPALRPESTTQRVPIRAPGFTMRISTVSSLPTTATL